MHMNKKEFIIFLNKAILELESEEDIILIKNIIDVFSKFDTNNFQTQISFWKKSQHDYLIWFIKKIKNQLKNTKISTLILVKDQENIISDVINSVVNISDELILIDTGSTDKTIDNINLHIENNSKIFLKHLTWVEDFSYMRNQAVSLANNNWVFFLDSDEIFTKPIEYEDLHLFISVLDLILTSWDVSIRIESHFPNSSGFFTPKRFLRLNDKTKFVGKVHEDIISSGKVLIDIQTNISVENYGMLDSDIDKFDKIKRYNDLLEKMMSSSKTINPRFVAQIDPRALEQNILNERYFKLIEESIFKDVTSGINLFNLVEGPYLHTLLSRFIQISVLKKNFDIALKASNIGLKKFPNSIPLLFSKYSIKQIYEQKRKKEMLDDLLLDYSSMDKDDMHITSLMGDDLIKALIGEFLFDLNEFDNFEKIVSGISDSEAINYLGKKLSFLK